MLFGIILLLSISLVSADSHIPAEIKAQCRAADNPPECITALEYHEDEPNPQELFKESEEYPINIEEIAKEKRKEEFKKRYDERSKEERFAPREFYQKKSLDNPQQEEQQDVEQLKKEIEQAQQRSDINRVFDFLKRIFSFNLLKEE